MVIIDRNAGQLANRTFLFAFFIANARQYGYSLYNPTFAEYAPLFPELAGGRVPGLPIRTRLSANRRIEAIARRNLARIQYRCTRLGWFGRWAETLNISGYDHVDKEFDLTAPAFRAKARHKLLFVQGWGFRDHENLPRHAALVRKIFTPHPLHCRRIDQLLSTMRERCDVVVGVHVRRGDYRKFFRGAYFFEWEDYERYMRRIENELADRRVGFLVCSNEAVPPAVVERGDVTPGYGDMLEDLYALARCDYLLAPPSTYSMWASFYGAVPLKIVRYPSEPLSMEMFSPIVSLNRFANGQIFGHRTDI